MKFSPETLVNLVWNVFRVVAVLYVAFLALLYFAQERLIFFPERLAQDHQFRFSGSFSERWIEFDGGKIHSLLFKSKSSKGVILYFHGNAGSLDGWGDVAAEIAGRSQWDVWIVDYPGYGKSAGGIRSEAQLHRMANAIWEAAASEYQRILIYGRSIGSGLATRLALEKNAAGLILETPYTSLVSLAKTHFPLVPSALLKYRLPNAEWLPQVKCPVLILHGTSDEVIPFDESKRLAEANPGISFVPIPGGRHNDLGADGRYWQTLTSWLAAR